MNFLAHFYFDKREHAPYYHLGLLLPDLIRNFVPNAKKFVWPLTEDGFELEQMRLGFRQHENRDLFFHSSAGFVHITAHLIKELRTLDITFKRDWFISHVLAELMLDRVLLMKHPTLAETLYRELEACDLNTILKIFGEENKMKVDFSQGFERFISHKYLETYRKEESIAYAMGRIASRVDIHILDTQYQEALIRLVRTQEKESIIFMDYLENAFQNT